MALHRIRKLVYRLAAKEGAVNYHFDFAVMLGDVEAVLYLAKHYMEHLDAPNRKIARRALKVTALGRVYKMRPRRRVDNE